MYIYGDGDEECVFIRDLDPRNLLLGADWEEMDLREQFPWQCIAIGYWDGLKGHQVWLREFYPPEYYQWWYYRPGTSENLAGPLRAELLLWTQCAPWPLSSAVPRF